MRPVFLVALILGAATASSQDLLEEIVVTGSRVSSASYGTPVVTLSKKADFLTQYIELVNDSRSPERRPAELIKTIENMMAAAKKQRGIELSYGSGFLVPVVIDDDILSTIDHDEVDEVSSITIVAKVAVNKQKSTREQIAALDNFISSTRLEGRTEIETLGDVGLSIINPQQYRNELLERIAADNKRMTALMGDDCTIRVSGLENRLQWVRGSVDELMLYIVYGTEIEC